MYHLVLAVIVMSILMIQLDYVSNDLKENFTLQTWKDVLTVRIAEMNYDHIKTSVLNVQLNNT